MKKMNTTIIFVVFLLLAVLITMPAAFLLKQVKLDENLSFGSVQGPWWSFNIDWINYKGFIQKQTIVTLKPSCIVTAAICFNIDNQQIHITLKKPLLDDTLLIENSFFNTDFIKVNPLLGALLLKPSGSLEIKIATLRLNQQALLDLKAKVYWHSVGVEGELFNLGSIEVDIKHQAGLIALKLADQSDKLDLSGYIKVSDKGLIDNNIQLSTLNGFPPSLKTIVQSVMKKRGNNIFEYKTKSFNPAFKRLNIKF